MAYVGIMMMTGAACILIWNAAEIFDGLLHLVRKPSRIADAKIARVLRSRACR